MKSQAFSACLEYLSTQARQGPRQTGSPGSGGTSTVVVKEIPNARIVVKCTNEFRATPGVYFTNNNNGVRSDVELHKFSGVNFLPKRDGD